MLRVRISCLAQLAPACISPGRPVRANSLPYKTKQGSESMKETNKGNANFERIPKSRLFVGYRSSSKYRQRWSRIVMCRLTNKLDHSGRRDYLSSNHFFYRDNV
jgi:hypothetical protein